MYSINLIILKTRIFLNKLKIYFLTPFVIIILLAKYGRALFLELIFDGNLEDIVSKYLLLSKSNNIFVKILSKYLELKNNETYLINTYNKMKTNCTLLEKYSKIKK